MTDITPTGGSAPGPSGAYTDGQAMDDLQAMLASRSRSEGEDAVDEIAEIAERTGRPVITPRLISAETRIAENSLPYAFVNAESTFVQVGHNARSNAIGISVWTIDKRDRERLVIELDGTIIVPALKPPGGAEDGPKFQCPAPCSTRGLP